MLKSLARRLLLAGCSTALCSTAAAGQQADSLPRPTMRAVWRTGAIRVDGNLGEEDWRRAEPATDFVQSRPNPGAKASYRTEARVVAGEVRPGPGSGSTLYAAGGRTKARAADQGGHAGRRRTDKGRLQHLEYLARIGAEGAIALGVRVPGESADGVG